MESTLSELRALPEVRNEAEGRTLSKLRNSSEIWSWKTHCWQRCIRTPATYGRCDPNKLQKWSWKKLPQRGKEEEMWLLQFPDHQSSVTAVEKKLWRPSSKVESLETTFRFSLRENVSWKFSEKLEGPIFIWTIIAKVLFIYLWLKFHCQLLWIPWKILPNYFNKAFVSLFSIKCTWSKSNMFILKEEFQANL